MSEEEEILFDSNIYRRPDATTTTSHHQEENRPNKIGLKTDPTTTTANNIGSLATLSPVSQDPLLNNDIHDDEDLFPAPRKQTDEQLQQQQQHENVTMTTERTVLQDEEDLFGDNEESFVISNGGLINIIDSETMASQIERNSSDKTTTTTTKKCVDDSIEVVVDEEDDTTVNECTGLHVTVDKAEKHSALLETYVTYQIITKTTRSLFEVTEACVRRRYQDFLWLRNQLVETQPTTIVPPLPEKHGLKRSLDRFDKDFLSKRERALDIFMKRIATHPTLSFNDNVKSFLTAKDMQVLKRESSGMVSRVGDRLRNTAASYMLKNRDRKYVVMNDYTTRFSDKLGTMNRIADRLIKEQTEYASVLNQYSPTYTQWVASEQYLAPLIEGAAHCIESCSAATTDLCAKQDEGFIPVLKEYTLYTDTVKEVLKRRDFVQMEHDLTQEELAKLKIERDMVNSGSHRILKLNESIDELQRQADYTHEQAKCAETDLTAELKRWDLIRKKDMKTSLIDFADSKLQYHNNCLLAWEQFIATIQKTSETHPRHLGSKDF